MMIDDLTKGEVMKTLPQDAIDALVQKIKSDYRAFNANMGGNAQSEHRQQMIAEFEAKVRVEPGKKYLKVITGGSVHSFICLVDNGKFKRGDILKPASWRGPATNFARGNVLDGTLDRVRWTGAL
jgi:hypothetical protein